MKFISAEHIENTLDYPSLIEALKNGFSSASNVPLRAHHDYEVENKLDSTLLMMPAWNTSSLGVKLVTVSPENGSLGLPSINGLYVLFNKETGEPKAFLDAKTLTNKRTAATSALASSYLSRKDSKSLLMIGTGSLAPELIKAHATVRGIKEVFIWGRNSDKAEIVKSKIASDFDLVTVVKELNKSVFEKSDIVSCATLSSSPLFDGNLSTKGQHFDLVGSYKKDFIEIDNQLISRSKIFVDTINALHESGDLKIPLEEGVIHQKDIKKDLFEMSLENRFQRESDDEITVFKSVGYALEDLVAAELIMKEDKNV